MDNESEVLEAYKNGLTYYQLVKKFGGTKKDYVKLFEQYDIKVCRNKACLQPVKSRSEFSLCRNRIDGHADLCKMCRTSSRTTETGRQISPEVRYKFAAAYNGLSKIKEKEKFIVETYKQKYTYLDLVKFFGGTKDDYIKLFEKYDIKVCTDVNCDQPIKVRSRDFSVLKSNRDGYLRICKDCDAKRTNQTRHNYKRINENNYMDIQFKYCSNKNCPHKEKPQSVENFTKNYYTRDGYCSYCKDCERSKSNQLACFDTYELRLSTYEEIRQDPNNLEFLQVKCKNSACQKWFNPTNQQVNNRISSIVGRTPGDSNFYCSEECKHQCPIYNQQTRLKGNSDSIGTNREVQPELRQMKINEVGYVCQRCDRTNFEDMNLECHHKEGIQHEPLESADLDMVMMTCEECHKIIHKIPGCTYQDMKCKF